MKKRTQKWQEKTAQILKGGGGDKGVGTLIFGGGAAKRGISQIDL